MPPSARPVAFRRQHSAAAGRHTRVVGATGRSAAGAGVFSAGGIGWLSRVFIWQGWLDPATIGQSMKCDLCNRPAVVHEVTVKSGVKKEVHLCEVHAREAGIVMPGQ